MHQLVAAPSAGACKGQSIAMVRASVTIIVRGMSRYLRIRRGVSGVLGKGKRRAGETLFTGKAKGAPNPGVGGCDKL